MTGDETCSPSDPSVKGWDRLFDSSPIKGEGEDGWFVLLSPVLPCRPVVSRLRGNDGVEGLSCCHPHL